MKNIEKWLQENGIEYRKCKYGNPDYFNDGFQIEGLRIAFYFDDAGNTRKQENQLVKFMSRKKAYICKPSRFGYGYSYDIMTVFDAARLEKHEKAVADAVEAFWQAEHARRIKEEKAI